MILKIRAVAAVRVAVGIVLMTPNVAAALVFVGASFDKTIDAIPPAGTIEPGELVAISDLNNDGIPDVQSQVLITDIGGAVVDMPGQDPEVDAASLIDKVPNGSGYTQTFVISFSEAEEVIAATNFDIQDEDLVQITTDGITFTSSLFLNLTGFVADNVDLNALHVLSSTEVLVSFDKDVTLMGSLDVGSVNVDKGDIAKLTFTDPNTITNASIFLNTDTTSDLDAFAILDDNSVIASFSSTIGLIQDQDVALLSTLGTGVEGSTILEINFSQYLNNTGVDTNVNLIALFERSIPEPTTLLLVTAGFLIPALRRRRKQPAARP